MSAKFCTNCGQPLEEDAKFCTGCGSMVEDMQPMEDTQENKTDKQEDSSELQTNKSYDDKTYDDKMTQSELKKEEINNHSNGAGVTDSSFNTTNVNQTYSQSEPNSFNDFSQEMSNDTYNEQNKRAGLGLGIVVIFIIIALIGFVAIRFLKGII